ncbi:MAG TPA: sugar ABC transporter ATP-binding protein [Solirubrobacterales bacterium]|nr:sugar ABC transporter ATP-binding protein [Solirubrobacterales bacterium]
MNEHPAAASTPDAGQGRAAAGSLLSVAGISKSFGAVHALDDVAFEVGSGEVHSLCGHNGAGKSTLVKILAGGLQPDAGTIRFAGEEVSPRDVQAAQEIGIALVEQELGLVPSLSVAENLELGNAGEPFIARRGPLRKRAKELLSRVGLADVPVRAPLSTLQPGERKLVQIAQALGRDARVLILDEPTAWLGFQESERVFAAIASVIGDGGAVIYVSHRLDEVFRLSNQVTVLRDGRRVGSCAIDEIDRPKLIEMMVGTQGSELPAPTGVRSGPAVSIERLGVPPRLESFSLEIEGGAIVGLAGQVGSGASDVLRCLAGLAPGARGSLAIGGRQAALRGPAAMARAGIAYVPCERQREGLFLDQSIEANLTATRLGALSTGGILVPARRRAVAKRLAELVNLPGERLRAPVGELSGGNQQKALIGRCLERRQGELLLLDDPTRGVDVKGRAEIHRLVRQAAAAGNTVIFLSTELDELLELPDSIVTIAGGRIVGRHLASEARAAQLLAEMTHAAAEEVSA